mmetsp:Transcript_88548/g.222961  ORF Transcript_88548/g.222961 Transcript_88548/m.222961 type:complete len:246 (+) Transcript_88548:88-825(+)
MYVCKLVSSHSAVSTSSGDSSGKTARQTAEALQRLLQAVARGPCAAMAMTPSSPAKALDATAKSSMWNAPSSDSPKLVLLDQASRSRKKSRNCLWLSSNTSQVMPAGRESIATLSPCTDVAGTPLLAKNLTVTRNRSAAATSPSSTSLQFTSCKTNFVLPCIILKMLCMSMRWSPEGLLRPMQNITSASKCRSGREALQTSRQARSNLFILKACRPGGSSSSSLSIASCSPTAAGSSDGESTSAS